MTFKMTVEHEVTLEEAMTSADEVERAVGEICNGKRKPGSIPMQEMFLLVQFVRDSAKRANVEHNRRTAASSPGVRVDGSVMPQEE